MSEKKKVWVELTEGEAAARERDLSRLADAAETLERQLPSRQTQQDPVVEVLREIRDVLTEIKERT